MRSDLECSSFRKLAVADKVIILLVNVLDNISVRLSDQWDFIPCKIQTFQMVSVSRKSTEYYASLFQSPFVSWTRFRTLLSRWELATAVDLIWKKNLWKRIKHKGLCSRYFTLSALAMILQTKLPVTFWICKSRFSFQVELLVNEKQPETSKVTYWSQGLLYCRGT